MKNHILQSWIPCLILLVAVSLVTGCQKINNIPVAQIEGPDFVLVGSDVHLKAEYSYDMDRQDPLYGEWTLVSEPEGSDIELNLTNGASVNFRPLVPGVYVVKLVVWDNASLSEPVYKCVTVSMNLLYISQPVADFFAKGYPFSTGSVITLDGTTSNNEQWEELSFSWYIVHKPFNSKVELSQLSSPTTSFQPDVEGEYTVGLTINDGKQFSKPCIRTIVVKNILKVGTYYLTMDGGLSIFCDSTLSNLTVEYGLDTNYGSSVEMISTGELSYVDHVTLNYKATIPNVAPLTTYHFRIKGKSPAGDELVSEDRSISTWMPDIDTSFIPGDTVYNPDQHMAYSVTGSFYSEKSVLLFIDMQNFSVNHALDLDYKVCDFTYAKDRDALYLISQEGLIQEVQLANQTIRTLNWTKPTGYGAGYRIEYQAPDLLYIVHSVNQSVPSRLGLLNIDSMQFTDLGSKLNCIDAVRPGSQYGEFFLRYKSPTGFTSPDDNHIFKYRLEGDNPVLLDRTPSNFQMAAAEGEILLLEGSDRLIGGAMVLDLNDLSIVYTTFRDAVKVVSPDETLAVTACGIVYDLNTLYSIYNLYHDKDYYRYFFDKNNTLYISRNSVSFITESQLRGE